MMIPEIKDEANYYCDLCSILINIHDKENHLNGNKHKYKLRKKESKSSNRSAEFECKTCETKFTNDEFYKIHMGSKTHRRNCRKKGIKFNVGRKRDFGYGVKDDGDGHFKPTPRRAPLQKTFSLEHYAEPTYYKSVKEKYRSTDIKNHEEKLQVYVNSLLAYWGVALATNPNVEDFKFSVDNKDWGKFGDVVLEINYVTTPGEKPIKNIYAISLKYISNNAKQIDDINKGKFNFSKLIAETLGFESPKSNEIIKYVIFTTAEPSPNFQPKLRLKVDAFHQKNSHSDCNADYIDISGRSLHKNDIINTVDEKENAFLLFSTDKTHPLPKVYLYAGQKKVKRFGMDIDEKISKLFVHNHIEIHQAIIDFITDWNDDLLGGSYKMNKEDILVKLGDLLLTPFATKAEVMMDYHQNFNAWNLAVNSVDVTILRPHPFILHNVCRPINLKLEQLYQLKIDPNPKEVRVPDDKLLDLDKALAMYLFEETIGIDFEHVPLDVVYRAFWKAGLIPLILHAEQNDDQEFIMQVITVLKGLGLTRKYMLKMPDANIENLTKTYKYLTCFVNLDDVIQKFPKGLLSELKIGISEEYSLDLSVIQENDKYFSKKITPNEYFDLTLGKYSFKECFDVQSEKEPEWKLVLNDELIEHLKQQIGLQEDYFHERENGWIRGINPELL
ncbi:uncharacterized protein LOC115884435 isoform X2 [Sitophilus oryzae]|uniref:Uncharacterized protein LOC115884435 isoform X2 n=1 Tax=Sitophilus oryzae TaxID=7048 RepID=A0A6J2Y7B5_SITOR|nr:uncharacterized protein LOC115884435 isoform X2 [Sitophilus oryzae]XP_030758865.1 uncharacterized protein LOC115884435 isoform X2 [Sitophilus oryzae]